jgi:tetratricopeptide (TPR) repeat protein
LQLHDRLDSPSERAEVLNALGLAYSAQQKWEQSLRLHEEALKVFTDLDHTSGRAETLLDRCLLKVSQGNYHAAVEDGKAAQHLFEEIGDRRGAARAQRALSISQVGLGSYHSARAYAKRSLETSLETYRNYGRAREVAQAQLVLGKVHSS